MSDPLELKIISGLRWYILPFLDAKTGTKPSYFVYRETRASKHINRKPTTEVWTDALICSYWRIDNLVKVRSVLLETKSLTSQNSCRIRRLAE